MKNPITQIVMPNFDIDQLLIEDQNYRSGKPLDMEIFSKLNIT